MSEKRFCPIQTLIMVAFIAIILAVLLPNYFHFLDERRNQRVVFQATSLQGAVNEYRLIYGTYPTDVQQLVKNNLLLADGLQNPFSGQWSLPNMDNLDPKLGELIYQFLDLNQDGLIEGYKITAYGKQYGELVPIANLHDN